MLEHLFDIPNPEEQIDNGLPPLPAYVIPNQVATAPDPVHQEQRDQLDLVQRRMRALNTDLPFTPYEKRRILENAMWMESLTATKGSERLKAMEMLGKVEGIDMFAAERHEVAVGNVNELRGRIANSIEALLGQAEEVPIGQIIDERA